ncbi:MAG: MopE-related protein [Polyangia bacterium]|jgi:hypothetical protein|nr:MopE-related protein [Polyangia bacterium]
MTSTIKRSLFIAATLGAAFALLSTCGPKHGSSGQPDASTICYGDDDCPAGRICVGNVCVLPGQDSGTEDVVTPTWPVIAVSPTALDFGFAPLRFDTVLPLTVQNDGTADLVISAILVEEVDAQREFHSDPEGVLSPNLTVPPGESIQITVTLHPVDAQLDNGQLRINSNDPNTPSLTVPLQSGYKGEPDLEACVLDHTVAEPEPFIDCAEDPLTQTPVLNFGVVQFQQDATRLVTVRNLADGNAPLTISSVSVTNTSGQAGHFQVELYWLEANDTEVPVTLPVYLRASDPLQALAADVLYIRLNFDAELDGYLPEEDLVIVSSDTPASLEIPIVGVVSGCPSGTWDLNGDPNDGCEYVCNWTGAETCDGVDNDCDGLVDEEGALGCTVYYRDSDYDTYGLTADSRCLCSPDPNTRHTSVTPGDCNDNKNTVHPGMLENCATPDDDDCDGDTNDRDAYGCIIYYADQDNDGYGVTTDSRCYCQPSGTYRATVGGDCDDNNPAVHPNRTEDCNTPQDDNCNGSANDEDSQNCLDFYMDLDNDNYGQTYLSKCLCVASGNYRASMPNDCNDNNANVNPSVPENCNTSYDDNCDGDTNEVGASNCTTYFWDSDNDGYGVTGNTRCYCSPMGNYRATVGGDCDDNNQNVKPSAAENCSTLYDDNCDGDTNDLNAQGCTAFYYDADGDNYGLTGNTQCRCVAYLNYRATVGGDCDDNNAAANPGKTEDCNTAFDDNCNGTNNDESALNCTIYFVDSDNDGYGNGSVAGQCRCAAFDLYRATVPGDCNDSIGAINPGITEICDGIDNNCVGGIDEGFNLLSDINHCGSCNHQCTNAHGSTSCVSGVCTPVCDSGWGNCDGDPSNGCETDLSLVGNCGTCSSDSQCPTGFFCSSVTSLCSLKLANGDDCSRKEMCQSNFCVDGVCCESACGGTCESCAITGSEGSCTAIGAGLDPDDECGSTAQATCGQNGFCSGTRTCAFWPTGTVCLAQFCSGQTVNYNDTCDGLGACQEGGTGDCHPYVCGTTACRTTCSDNAHCVAGYYCSGGACVMKKPNGGTCLNPAECQNSNCVEGYCCDTPCSGACRSCALPATLGTCTNITAGTDPRDECGLCRTCNGSAACVNAASGTDPKSECTLTPQSGCLNDGECNGTGGCRLWAPGTECAAQVCTGFTKYLQDTCNGLGTCSDGGTVNCSPYLCDGAGLDCRTSCTLNTHCITGSYCDGGVCFGKKADGQACSDGSQCTSNFCFDGVCCNADCSGTCKSCNLTGNVGFCTNIPANQDPDSECAGTCKSCNGSGSCGNTAAGLDPETECAETAASTCSTDGQCNGSGACRLWASGTECVAQSCTGSTLYLPDTCNGSGTCSDNGSAPCSPYVCNTTGTACRTDCSLDTHCVTGYYCSGGSCLLKQTDGQSCTAGGQCQSGNCVDGYCCNSDCLGPCRACNVSGSLGTCVNHTINTDPEGGCPTCQICDGLGECTNAASNTDPKNNCSAEAQSTCNLNGQCDGSGACAFWPSGTVCVSAVCLDEDTLSLSDTCNGSGTCVDMGTQECLPYICSGAACRTSCTSDLHCIAGFYCSGTSCVSKLSGGQPCTAGNQCQSNYCADGVCCNDGCAGLCRSCNRAGSVGLCTTFSNGTDPENECGACQVCNGSGACTSATAGTDPKDDCAQSAQSTCGMDGQCNGAGGCRFWPLGTVCVSQSCTGSTKSSADTCNGSGTCVDGGTTSCVPYICSGNDCATGCAAQSDCTTGYYCNTSTGQCLAKKATGQACDIGDECTSTWCVDGVCCNNSCIGVCKACNISGSSGSCTNYAAQTDPETECGLCKVCSAGACVNATNDTDPKNECGTSSQASCGLDGHCDGAGACGYWPNSTVCVAESCSNHIKQLTDYCSGSGACSDSGTQDCSPYECDGVNCRTSCSGDLHCIAGYYCSGTTCLAKKPLGQTCTANNQCTSGSCADGVCCNIDCAGACRSCAIIGSLGTCTNYTTGTDPEAECGLCKVCNTGACVNASNGTDPKDQCTQNPQSGCQQDGQCDGSGACRLWASGTQCVAQTCVGSTLYPADLCNGTGTCSDSGSQACPSYFTCLNTTTCRTTCTDNAHCITGYFCNASNQCQLQSGAGTPCTFDSECGTNMCRDGYCCNNDCTGACRACNVPGYQGTCTYYAANTDPEDNCSICQACNGSGACANVTAGTDPLSECTTEAQSSCGLNGNCNGSGACAFYSSGTVCVTQTCVGSTLYLNDTCNGSGVCTDGGMQACANNYMCLDGTNCRTSCTDNAHCVTGYYCNGGSCAPKLPDGTACTSGTQCEHNYCVDGVCCNNSCTGACRACNRSGSVGTCSYHPANTDPEDNCPVCQVCNGSGACANVANGLDPLSECTQQPQSSCKEDGQCNGSGACRYWVSGTQCIAVSCVGSTLYPADLCNGSGTCSDSGTTSCGAYQCNDAGTGCRTSCTSDLHCTSSYYCNAGTCSAKLSLGSVCTGGNQCTSNNCVDGRCCNNACTETCKACNVSGSLGTCTNVPSNTDPINECGHCRACNGAGACTMALNNTDPKGQCTQDPVATCDQDGMCNGSGVCRLWASGTVCAAQTCVGSTLYPNDLCNGTGDCSDGGSQACANNFLCANGTSCRTSCTLDSQCVSGYLCNTNVCCLDSATGSGASCGLPDTWPSYLWSDEPGTQLTWTGNVVPYSAERWYEFIAYEWNNTDGITAYIWLSQNPGTEFAIEVWAAPYNSYTSPTYDVTCLFGAAVGGTGCTVAYDKHTYSTGTDYWPYFTDHIMFYVKVYRRSGKTATCNNFELKAQMKGTAPF